MIDMEPFIDIALALAGVFAICAAAQFIQHRQDSEAIKSQTALGIQSIVAITTMGVTGSMAEETVELHAVPTPDLNPPTLTAKATS